MNRQEPKTWSSVFWSLVMPLVLGLAMHLCFGLLIDREVITDELLLRYLTGHPISRITTFMFFVGVATLMLLANNVFDQFCSCEKIRLDEGDDQPAGAEPKSDSLSPADRVDSYLENLYEYSWSLQTQYLWRRLYGALSFVKRTGSSVGLEDEIKYLADMDHERQQGRYSLARIVIWATPMLGFLGTVLGISEALGGIQVGPDNNFETMLNGLRASLFVAFDTTALALTLSIVLMFFMFFVDRFEQQLLDMVQLRASEELSPLYQDQVFADRQTQAVEGIGRVVMESTRKIVDQQAAQWNSSFKNAEGVWANTVTEIGKTVQASLAESLRAANVDFADSITRGIERADESMAKRWEQWRELLTENARQLSHNQAQIVNQIKVIEQLLERTEAAASADPASDRSQDVSMVRSELNNKLHGLANSLEELKAAGTSSQKPLDKPRLRIYRSVEENLKSHQVKRNAA